jgi:hypothetical protein
MQAAALASNMWSTSSQSLSGESGNRTKKKDTEIAFRWLNEENCDSCTRELGVIERDHRYSVKF